MRTVLFDFKDCKAAVGEVITLSRGKVKLVLTKDEVEAIYKELVPSVQLFPAKPTAPDNKPSKYRHEDLATRKAEMSESKPIDPSLLQKSRVKGPTPIGPEFEEI